MGSLETLNKLRFTADLDRVGDTRAVVAELLKNAGIFSHYQLIYQLTMFNNRLELKTTEDDDKPAYILSYQFSRGWLMCFNLSEKFKTPICWWEDCREGHTSGNEYLLCKNHSKVYERQTLPKFKVNVTPAAPINNDKHILHFGHCDMRLDLANFDMADQELIANGIAHVMRFVKGVREKHFNPFHSDENCGLNKKTKRYLTEHIKKNGVCRIGHLKLSFNYNTSQLQFSTWNGRGWSRLKSVCDSDACCAPAVGTLSLCRWCGRSDWKPLVFKTLLNIVGKTDWREMNDDDLPALRMEIQAAEKERIIVNQYLCIRYLSLYDSFIAVYLTSSYLICTNFDSGCQNLYKFENYNNLVCDRCDDNYVYAGVLLTYKPTNGLASLVVKRRLHADFNYCQALKKLVNVPSGDISTRDLDIVRVVEFYNDKVAAASVASGFLLYIIFIQDFYTRRTTNILNVTFEISPFMWRFVRILSSEMGIVFQDRVTQLQYAGTVEELIDYDFNFEQRDPHESRAWIYTTPLDDIVYYGLNQERIRNRKTIVANCHAGGSRIRGFELVREHMIRRGLLTSDENVVGKLVGIVKNPSIVGGAAIETIILAGETYNREMYKWKKIITNCRFSTTDLPRDKALPALQRAIHKESGFTFKLNGVLVGTSLPRTII